MLGVNTRGSATVPVPAIAIDSPSGPNRSQEAEPILYSPKDADASVSKASVGAAGLLSLSSQI